MVDFAAHITIHVIIGFQKLYYILPGKWSLKVVPLPIACQSEHSPSFFHLGRISDLFAIHHLSSHTLLAAEKRFKKASSAHQ